MSPSGRLAGKRALITGGSRGLGRALALAFAAEGARVAFTYARADEEAQRTVAGCLAVGAEALARRVSVLDVPGTEALVAELETAWGGIDILVNNAAITQNLPLPLIEEEDWDRLMDVNVKGAFLTSRAVLPGMMRQHAGVIVHIGSLAGERVIEAPVHYCASKAALRGLAEGMAKAVGRHNIRVLCLAPGLLDEGVVLNVPENRLADYVQHTALRRVGSCDEVARLAVFLVSDASSYTSGATVRVDGGI